MILAITCRQLRGVVPARVGRSPSWAPSLSQRPRIYGAANGEHDILHARNHLRRARRCPGRHLAAPAR